MSSPFTPGTGRLPSEEKKWNVRHSAGRMQDTRKAWATLPKFDAILFVGNKEDSTSKQNFEADTPPVRIEIRIPGRRNPTMISLTHMTAAELNVFEEFFLHAISKARPICETLDQRAQEAFENGDDSFERLYRPVPQFVDRERGITKHGESVPSRPEGSDEQYNYTGDNPESNDDGDSGGATSDGSSQDADSEHDQ